MFVCVCNAVSDSTILKVVRAGASTVEQVGACTGAGMCCGCCRDEVAAILVKEHSSPSTPLSNKVLNPT